MAGKPRFSTAIGTLRPGRSPSCGGSKGGVKALPFAADAWPGVAQSPRRDLRRGLVDEDPADPVGMLGLHDDLEVPVIVVARSEERRGGKECGRGALALGRL